MEKTNSKNIFITIGAIVAVVVIFASILIGQYNKAIRMDEAVNAQWAQVENQLKRCFDLIPNLVETVKGYAKHERETFEFIANARTKYFSAQTVGEKAKAASGLEGALSRLLLLQEKYPELKANESFLKLQDSLEGTENRIAVERGRYNENVRVLNAYIRSFFGRFFANWAGVKQAEYFLVPEAEKETPKVTF
jgi:LemA protein